MFMYILTYFDKFIWTKSINLFARKLALYKRFRRTNSDRGQQILLARGSIRTLEELRREGKGEIKAIQPPLTTLKGPIH